MGIKTKLIIPTTVIIILIAAAILTTNIALFFTYIDDSTAEEIDLTTKNALNLLENYKAGIRDAALALSKEESIIGAVADGNVDKTLDSITLQLFDGDVEICTITDANGNVISSNSGLEQAGFSAVSRPSVRSALDGKTVTCYESGPIVKLSIQSGTPVYNGQGDIIGAVTVGIRLDTDSFVDETKLVTNCETSFFVNGESVATTVLRDDGRRAVRVKADPEIMETLESGTPYAGRVEVLGRAAICSYTPVEGPDGGVIGVLFLGRYVDDADMLIQSFVMGGLVITIVMLVASIAIILVIVQHIVTPIEEMTKAASALAIGDTELDINVKTKDEMETLADAFNSIISNTRQQIEIVKYIANGEGNLSVPQRSNIEVVENIASGDLETMILPRSDKDEMNMALEKLNVTIREQSEALREEHSRTLLLLDANPLACRLWDRDINLIECNEAAVKLFDLKDKQEYISRYFELAPEYQPNGQPSRDKIKMMVSSAFKKGTCKYDFVYQLLDGTPLPTEVTLVRVPYGNDFVVAAYSRDLREQIKMISEIEQRDNIMQTVNRIADILLRSKPEIFDNTLYKSMRMMTNAIDADRMYIHKNYTENEMLYCTQIYEWSENVQSFQNNAVTSNVLYDEVAPETKKILQSGGCVHTLIRNLPESDREQYEVQGVLSLMLIPVFIHNVFWGFVGFDNCHSERLFTDNEESIVRSGSMLIANALLRNEYVQSIHDASYELETALEEAEKANNAKGDFLASMSHEMRTPLNAIIGLSEIALDDVSLSDESVSNLEKIHNSGSTLLSIVNDILDVSKIQSGKFEIMPEQYDVPSMVNDAVIQNVLRIGSRPIRFILNIDENMPARLYGDELRIKQIVNNLLSNAIKYTEEGSVTLSIDYRRDGDSVWLTLSVKDTGVGIKKEHLENLFTDFVQFGSSSKHQAGGTGLGLSITKSLAEMMNGGISVESEYGAGSTFTVRLEQGYIDDTVIGAEVAKNISGFQYSPNKLSRKNRTNRIQLPYARVLLVDDNVTNLDVAKGLMKPYGMKIDCVTSGIDAIGAIRDEIIRYDAIFMDHMMPEMNGVEATRIIREEIGTDYARNIPIIALTANAVAGSEEMFLKKGFQAFISKPIDIKKLDAAIHRWVRDKNLENKYANAYRDSNPLDINNSLWNGINISGIDITGALERFSGDDEILNIILRSYATSTRSLLNELGEYLNLGKYEDYTIGVHGVKGTSYSVFAQEVGKAAEELEALSKAGDFDTVKIKHEAFRQTAEALLDELDKALGKIDAALNSPPPAAVVTAERSRFDFTAPGAKILIVDDNETNLKVALGLLKPLQMTMDTAENGQTALRMIRKNRYHLIFMDHFMPVMDGIEATVRLRKMEEDYFQNVPVIALSASDSSETRTNFIQAGMNDFVTKPIDVRDIQKKIKHWLPDDLVKDNASLIEREDGAPEAPADDGLALPVIEGIDTAEGIRYSGSKELFTDLLGNFYKLTDIKANKIEKCLADGLIRDVTIEVHALKSTARMIGAGELSKEFARLEDYGKAEDLDALMREVPTVLEHYRSYKPILKPYGEAAETEKRQAGTEEIVRLLRMIQSSMDGFDLDGADDALKKLDELRMPEECQEKMEALSAYVADVAMEDVVALAEEIITMLQG